MTVAGDVGVRKAVGRLYGVRMPTVQEVRVLTARTGGAAAHIAQQMALESCVEAACRESGGCFA